MLEIDAQHRVISGNFIRVGGDAYTLDDIRGLVNEFRSKGFAFGLHSECYLRDDWLASLKAEVSIFSESFGFAPDGLNAHGYGRFRIETREAFYRGVTSDLLKALGIVASDLHDGFRRYDYVIDDSHSVGPAAGLNDFRFEHRRILTDALSPPPAAAGVRRLVLTHPGYWQ